MAVLLALFLGGFGIHKFYLNRPGSGFLYLLFCWTFIPAILGFIAAIYYLTLSNSTFQRKYTVSPLTSPEGFPRKPTSSLPPGSASPPPRTAHDSSTSVIRDALVLAAFVGVLVAVFGISRNVDPFDGEVPATVADTTSSSVSHAERISVYVADASWMRDPDLGWVPTIRLDIANEGGTPAPQLDFTATFSDATGVEIDAVSATLWDLDGYSSRELMLRPSWNTGRAQPGTGWTFDVRVRRAGGDEKTVIGGRAIATLSPPPEQGSADVP